MDNNLKNKLRKEDILTIPNFLSFFRILLIPVIVMLYNNYQLHLAAVFVIFLSGLTDIADGKIARKYNMTSDFGKFLDPLADKLTQAAMVLCLISKYKSMIGMILIMIFKEIYLFSFSYITFKKTGIVNSAKWYGKATTLTLYGVMTLLFLFPDISATIAQILIFICIFVIVASMLLYSRLFYMNLKSGNQTTINVS